MTVPSHAPQSRGLADRITDRGPWLAVVLAATFALRRLDNTDTWWHLAGGRWIVQHGRIPYLDPLSHTAGDHPWINVQWLFDVSIYSLYALGGPSLLVVAATLAYTGATAIMVATMRQRASPLVTTLMGAWVVLASQDRFAIRPEMATFLWLQVVLWLYATGRRADSRRLWLLVPVMMLWANMHSLFIVGVVVIGAQLGAVAATRLGLVPVAWRPPIDARVTRRVLASGLAALAATSIGPFGLAGATFPLKLLARVRQDDPVFSTIGEFQPPFSSYFVTFSITLYRVLFVVAVALVLATIVLTLVSGASRSTPVSRAARRRGAPAVTPAGPLPIRPLDTADLAVFLGLAYLSLLARRNVALFAMGCAPFLAACLQALVSIVLPGVERMTAARRAAGLALSVLLLATTWFVASNGFYRWNGELREFGLGVLDAQFPIRAVEFAREQALPPPLFNDFSNGGYLAWAEPVPGGVYVDGRTEVYDPEFLGQYTALVGDPAAWQADADRRGIQTVIFLHRWPNHQTLAHWLVRDSRWALVFFDHSSIVLVRRAGNEALVERAQAAFEPIREEEEAALLAPVHSWQWPVGRARAVSRYGAVLDLMGRAPEAMRFYDRFLDLGGSLDEEVGFALRLARYHAATGSLAVARRYLARAAALDPESPRVARVRATIER